MRLDPTRLAWVTLLCACSGVDRPAATAHPSTEPVPGAEAWNPVDPKQLVIMSGAIAPAGRTRFWIRSGGMRGQLSHTGASAIEVDFAYLGPSSEDVALASGELRRQIGVKLRAQDTCNVVYVMWHIEPSRGLEVSIKANAGQREHVQCGDHGYTFVRPSWSRDVQVIREGSRHTLSAGVDGSELRVFADGELSWVGRLPAEAFAFDGPPGLRSDNGTFDVELRTPKAAPP